MSWRLVVVGAGTGVGKTHACVAVLGALAGRGYEAAGLKPIESGVGSGVSDAEQLRAASMFHVKHAGLYAFTAPLSPHLAATREGLRVDLATIVRWVDACPADVVVVETAGGLLSPLAAGVTNLDLVRALGPNAVLLVALDRLGVLHEVTACMRVLSFEDAPLADPAVLLQAPAVADDSTGTNSEELRSLGIARMVTAWPRDRADSPAVLGAADTLLSSLRFPSAT